MAAPLNTSSFQLPAGEKVEIVVIRTAGGRIVVRRPEELEPRPSPSPIVGEPRRI